MKFGTKHKSYIISTFFLVCLFLSPYALASGSEARAAFASGVSLFQKGRFTEARAAFERALAKGLKTPVLFYDLGATEFKLGDLSAAKTHFERIAGDPHFGQYARYNLGLIAKRQGNISAARSYFSYVDRRGSDPSLRVLAHKQLSQLGAEKKVPRAVGFLELESGYDSNVILRRLASTVTPTQQGSALYGVLAGGAGVVNGSWSHGLQLNGSMFYRGFTAVGGYNQLLVQAGPKYRFGWGGWKWETSGKLSYFRFGGATLETTVGVHARASHALGAKGTISFRGGVARANGGSQYGYLSGNIYSVGAKGEWTFDSTSFSVDYDHQVERRNDLQTGTQFFSVSPTSDHISGSFNWAFTKDWSAGIHASYSHARYRDPDVFTQNTTLVTVRRVDDYSSVRLSLTRDLFDALSLELSAEHDRNSSTVTRYSYAQNVYLLRMSYLF